MTMQHQQFPIFSRRSNGLALLVTLILSALSLGLPCWSWGQSASATLAGSVKDPSGAVVQGADVSLTNAATGERRKVASNDSGEFVISDLSPASYAIEVKRSGFENYKTEAFSLNGGDRKTIHIVLQVGSVADTVTVTASEISLVTTSASVSSVVDANFVQEMPLNGRSFQDLLLLMPGTLTNSPQNPSSQNGQSGQLSVNGQGYQSNGFSVDGVTANVNAGNTGGFTSLALGGGLPSNTALGTTQSLVSVDALQEFSAQTSSYSAEYGRYPGAQITMTTRSGGQSFHGTLYNYLRNSAMDANDWFNNWYGTPRPTLQQNDFGGTLGGPVFVPHVYEGRQNTFFFLNYEGLRLNQPIPASIAYVPSAALRAGAGATPLGAVLNSFPMPNGPDMGDGLAEYIATYSAPSKIDSESVRVDRSIGNNEKAFYRYSNTPSSAVSYGLAKKTTNEQNNRTQTAGLTSILGASVINDFRANFTSNHGQTADTYYVKPGAGGTSDDLVPQAGYPDTLGRYYIGVDMYFAQTSTIDVTNGTDSARGLNLVDSLNWTHKTHQFKFGVDYRRLTSTNLSASPNEGYMYYSQASVMANQFDYTYLYAFASSWPGYINFSAYGQDEWALTPRLHLSYGLRWDVNPPPSSRRGPAPYSYININNLSQLALAPAGTPIYKTSYTNLAPRIGLSYQLPSKTGYETVLRAATGLFYDTISDQWDILANFVGPGFAQGASYCPYSYCTNQLPAGGYTFPLPSAQRNPVIQYPAVAPYTFTAYVIPQNVAMPYSIEGNVGLQQNIGVSNALTMTYVLNLGHKNIGNNEVYAKAINPNFQSVLFMSNELQSAYNAAQAQFQHTQGHGLHVFAGYTWSHAITPLQLNAYEPYFRTSSSGDVRHNGNAAITWDSPKSRLTNKVANYFASNYGLDARIALRTGFPLTLHGNGVMSAAAGGANVNAGLNYVSGQPIYIYDASVPKGKRFNSAAFTNAPDGTPGNVPINYYRGYGEEQLDMALRRTFPLYEKVNLQFKVDAFNILNHPNFGSIDTTRGDANFGEVSSMLSSSLGGLASQYQSGGARSMQVSLKLMF